LPPAAKNRSRPRRALNCATSPADTGALTPATDCAFQVVPDVSMNDCRLSLKNLSSSPPGANSRAKSSSGMSLLDPGVNG
jgi:hypothetical protein